MSDSATIVAPVTTPTAQAPELYHEWCCNRNRGLCGADLTGADDCPDDLSCGCVECVVCDDLVYLPVPCGPGCDWPLYARRSA